MLIPQQRQALFVRCKRKTTFQSMIAEQLKKFFDPFVYLNIQVWENFEKLGGVFLLPNNLRYDKAEPIETVQAWS